jgi:predicted metal-binding protein
MIRRARARWQGILLVCAKCEKKLKGGFGVKGRDDLSALLRDEAGGKGGKARFGVVSAKCLKACPKGAVAVVDANRPTDWLIVEAGTAVAAVVAEVEWLHPPAVQPSSPA